MPNHDTETEQQRHYARAPITEAVIEFQFATPLEFEAVEETRGIFAKDFPGLNEIAMTMLLPSGSGAPPQMVHSRIGFRMDNADSTDIVSLTTNAFAYSRLAPYETWQQFSTSALDAYDRLRRKMGYVPVKRIGIRYINRIDVPLNQPQHVPIRLEDYLTIEPKFPEDQLPPLQGFTMQTAHPLSALGCLATITIASAPSPVPARMALILDIDVGRNDSVPQSENEIHDLLQTMRVEKNRIFELAITDATRRLFD
jgi:uncharacterized protein (TIGR04255 family)